MNDIKFKTCIDNAPVDSCTSAQSKQIYKQTNKQIYKQTNKEIYKQINKQTNHVSILHNMAGVGLLFNNLELLQECLFTKINLQININIYNQ